MNYYIASLKHTNRYHEHITWWGRMGCGYTPVLGDRCGQYVYGYAVALNDGSTVSLCQLTLSNGCNLQNHITSLAHASMTSAAKLLKTLAAYGNY